MPEPLPITPSLVIPAADISYAFSRSSGPGGQHVNTTDSRVQLRFDLQGTAALGEPVKQRIRQNHGSRLTRDGALLLSCGRHREQPRNLAEVRQRLVQLIRDCLQAPRPRRPTRPSQGARRRRLENKRRRSQLKRSRGPVRGDDD